MSSPKRCRRASTDTTCRSKGSPGVASSQAGPPSWKRNRRRKHRSGTGPLQTRRAPGGRTDRQEAVSSLCHGSERQSRGSCGGGTWPVFFISILRRGQVAGAAGEGRAGILCDGQMAPWVWDRRKRSWRHLFSASSGVILATRASSKRTHTSHVVLLGELCISIALSHFFSFSLFGCILGKQDSPDSRTKLMTRQNYLRDSTT